MRYGWHKKIYFLQKCLLTLKLHTDFCGHLKNSVLVFCAFSLWVLLFC